MKLDIPGNLFIRVFQVRRLRNYSETSKVKQGPPYLIGMKRKVSHLTRCVPLYTLADIMFMKYKSNLVLIFEGFTREHIQTVKLCIFKRLSTRRV